MGRTTTAKKRWVVKASGERQAWDPRRLRQSVRRAGVPEKVAREVVHTLDRHLRGKVTSARIFREVSDLLAAHEAVWAARYGLKQAIVALGPEGYRFERLVARMLEAQGFAVQVGQIVQGHCVTHEVDVVALKDDRHYMVECKFHTAAGRKCDVKTPLYVHARFRDIEAQWRGLPGHATRFHQAWLVNNTRFTTDALQYGQCVGMHLISWDFPEGGSLRQMVEQTRSWPVTCLYPLSKREMRFLLDRDILLCKDLVARPAVLEEAGIEAARRAAVLELAGVLSGEV